MPKVLIITYYWPPSGGAGVQRWLKFSKYLPEYGWEPVIYTPENPEAPATDLSLEKDIPEGITVLKTPIWEPYSIYKRFVGMKKNEPVNAGFLNEKKKSGPAERVSLWIRSNFFIPDARRFWIKPSVKYLSKYLKSHPVDVIVSTGPPHSMHLIALGLKRKLGIKWVADFRDTWTGIDFYHELLLSPLADKKHRRIERDVLRTADSVIGATIGMSDELRELGAARTFPVLNGYDEDDFKISVTQDSSSFSIVHIGAINKDRTHPAFFEALSDLCGNLPGFKEAFLLKFVGKVDILVKEYVQKYGLEANVQYISYVPHEKIPFELMGASLLYLPVNNTPIAKKLTTGKLFEYLAAGRPILATGPLDGEAARILDESESGTMLEFEDAGGIANRLKEYYALFLKNELLLKNSDKISQYSRKSLTGKLVRILEN